MRLVKMANNSTKHSLTSVTGLMILKKVLHLEIQALSIRANIKK
ncbi:hypothetical protein D1AOALGA4SA_4892 [Olavius algarvensis Delta 1 endosymbiont]|nr:hypothetical protein D1AOALGA4SA_4892 [Olavius algarvensis Delta 1 endosymbiont]